ARGEPDHALDQRLEERRVPLEEAPRRDTQALPHDLDLASVLALAAPARDADTAGQVEDRDLSPLPPLGLEPCAQPGERRLEGGREHRARSDVDHLAPVLGAEAETERTTRGAGEVEAGA